MTDDETRYDPWCIKGTYMNHMLHCGTNYNGWVQEALKFLPDDILDDYKESLAFISTGETDGCRVAREICEHREIIILSERILPRKGMYADNLDVRYFMFAVLHEVAHVYLKHQSPMFDGISSEENYAQEDDADKLALQWYNKHVYDLDNPNLNELTIAEIEEARARKKAQREAVYNGL